MPEAAISLTAPIARRSPGKSPTLTPMRLVGGTDVERAAAAAGQADAAAPGAAPITGGATPVWDAFVRWCAAQHAQHRLGSDDETMNRLGDAFRAAEKQLRDTRPVTARDFAAKAYAALHVADYYPEAANPLLLGAECNLFTQAMVADILASFPEIGQLIMGETA